MIEMFERLPPGLRRFVLYVLCGGSGFTLDFALYSLLIYWGVWYQGANVVGYAAGTLLSFVLNRAITFRVMDAPLRRLATFFAVAFVGYVLSSLALFGMVDGLGIHPLIAKVLSLVVVVATQFTLNTLITFREKQP